MPELVILMIIILLVFGPDKLPEIGAGMGNAIRSFKSANRETGSIEKETDLLAQKDKT